ncbi:unnamed protein product, partial [Nesidiocoris tenuis]
AEGKGEKNIPNRRFGTRGWHNRGGGAEEIQYGKKTASFFPGDTAHYPEYNWQIAREKNHLKRTPSNREYWYEMGRAAVLRRAGSRSYEQLGKAKNVVLLVADGLGVTTNTAARVYKGQRHGQTGEEASLAWDNFPALAMTKMGTSRRHQDSSEDHMLNDHALKEGHVFDRSQVSILGPENPEAPENKKIE